MLLQLNYRHARVNGRCLQQLWIAGVNRRQRTHLRLLGLFSKGGFRIQITNWYFIRVLCIVWGEARFLTAFLMVYSLNRRIILKHSLLIIVQAFMVQILLYAGIMN